jgi:tRNA dimethylallyltransferase
LQPEHPALILGIEWSRAELYRRIDERTDAMMAAGLVEEVRGLLARGYDCGLPSLSSIGYRQVCRYLAGEMSLAEAIEKFKTENHRLARMQSTWFRRDDKRIQWLPGGGDLKERATDLISIAL